MAALTAVASVLISCGNKTSSDSNSVSASPGAIAAGEANGLPKELAQILDAHRKLIVLFADEKSLSEKEKPMANQVGQAIFHENIQRQHQFEKNLEQTQNLSASQREAKFSQILDFVETGEALFDADRLAFREVLKTLENLTKREQTLTAIKLHKRISEDLSALQEVERIYDKEIQAIFSRFESRAIELKRERWDAYLAHLNKLYQREQILKEYGVILPYANLPADSEDKEISGRGLPAKTVVLTFDDGPHASYTDEVAAILKQYNVPAVFFQVGKNVGSVDAEGHKNLNKNAETSKKLKAAGHVLANHSFSHALLSKQSGEGLLNEISQTDQLLKTIDQGRSSLFRFPYGAKSQEGMEILSKLGLRSVMWNIDSLDWADPVPNSIVQRVMRTVEKEQRGIILFHDIHERTVKALPLVLEQLIAEGYAFAGWDGQEFKVTRPGKASANESISTGYQNSWAIVIGINDYQKWPKLQYAVNDALAVKDSLIRQMGFAPERVLSLSNAEATRNNILALFHDKLGHGQLKRDDRVFVFFAGHGATRKLSSGRNLGYIIPYDSDPEQVSVDAIPMSDLQNIAESLTAKHVLFVMDACYSGLGLTRGSPGNAFLRENARRLGRQMLTAGGADQLVADGGPNGHSVFTWTLLQAMNGKADLNGDGLITATELAAYIAPAVASVSSQTPAFGNLPGSEGGEFVFEIRNEGEFINEKTGQLSAEAIALNSKLETATPKAGSETAVVVKNLSGGEQKIAAPKLVQGSARQLAQRANDQGLIYYKEKRYAEAEAAFTEALKYRPDFALAANNLGFVYYKQQKFQQSARWFENAVKMDPSRAIAYLNMADALAHMQQNDAAKKAYQNYLELAPGGSNANYAREAIKKLSS